MGRDAPGSGRSEAAARFHGQPQGAWPSWRSDQAARSKATGVAPAQQPIAPALRPCQHRRDHPRGAAACSRPSWRSGAHRFCSGTQQQLRLGERPCRRLPRQAKWPARTAAHVPQGSSFQQPLVDNGGLGGMRDGGE